MNLNVTQSITLNFVTLGQSRESPICVDDIIVVGVADMGVAHYDTSVKPFDFWKRVGGYIFFLLRSK